MALVDGTSKTHIILLLLVLGNLRSLKHIGSEGRPAGKPTGRQCVAHEVTEGQQGRMTFFIREDINFSAVTFFGNLVRTHEPDWDILFCEQLKNKSKVDCKVHNDHYLCTGVKDHRLTVEIPDITKNFEDTYIFQAYVDSKPEPPDFCYLSVKKRRETPPAPPSAEHFWDVATAISVTLMTIMIIGIVVFYLRNRMRNSRANPQDAPSQQLLLQTYGTESHKTMRWYFPNITKEDENKLLQFHRNGPGSFLVRVSHTNSEQYVLVVSFNGMMNYLTFIPKKKGLVCPSTGHSFRTLCGAVNYYKHNDIKVNNTVWCKLSKPFEQDLDEAWYFGELPAKHEQKVWLSETSKPGSFLIAVSSNDPEAYYLMVKGNEGIIRFSIIPKDTGFDMIDTGRTFSSLSELVESYTSKEIETGVGVSYGQLHEPCSKVPYEGWYFKTFTTEDENMVLKLRKALLGSFWIRDGSSPNTYILAVYLDDDISRFRIQQEGHGFKFLLTGLFFYTWYGLVDYHRTHDIKVNERVFGKLARPLRKEWKEDWYFGSLSEEDEKTLALTGINGPGAFLIRDGVSEQDNSVLAVNFDGTLKHFTIIPGESGFTLYDTGKDFQTLTDLVDYYKNNPIEVDDCSYGKLSVPFRK